MSISNIIDARNLYNRLTEYQYNTRFKHRKYLVGSKYINMFGLLNINVIDYEKTSDININVTIEDDESMSCINVRKAPTSLCNEILTLHKRLNIEKGNSRSKDKNLDDGDMHAMGRCDYGDEYSISSNNIDIQKMISNIGKERKHWFMSTFPDIYQCQFDKDIDVPYMSDSLSDMMVHSISLANASHYDCNDISITISTWVEETINNTENWYLVFPNVTIDNVKAVAIKLFHGCTICWDASKLRHASSKPNYRIRGGGTSSGNCQLRKKFKPKKY